MVELVIVAMELVKPHLENVWDTQPGTKLTYFSHLLVVQKYYHSYWRTPSFLIVNNSDQ